MFTARSKRNIKGDELSNDELWKVFNGEVISGGGGGTKSEPKQEKPKRRVVKKKKKKKRNLNLK